MWVVDYYRGTTPTTSDYKYIRSTPNGNGVLQLAKGAAVCMYSLDQTDGCYRTFSPRSGWIRYYELEGITAVYKQVAAPTVPVVASASIPMSGSFAVTATPDLASFTHTLALTIGGATVPIELLAHARDAQTGVETWTISTVQTATGINWLTFAPASLSVAGVLTMTTYQDNGTLEGANTLALTFTVPDTVVPAVGAIGVTRAAGDPTNGMVAEYVQGYTKLRITAAACQPGTGAQMTGLTLRAEGRQLTGWTGADAALAQAVESFVPAGYGSMTIIATATDSRGRMATREYLINVSRYYSPIIGAVQVERCDALGAEYLNGTGLAVTVPIDATLQGGQLSLTTQLAIAPVSSPAAYVAIGDAAAGVRTVYPGCADPDQYYLLRVTTADGLSTSMLVVEVDGGKPVMDVWRGGLGVAFGMTATRANVLEVGGRYRLAGDGVFETWTHSRSASGVHNFAGHGTCGKARITAAYASGDTYSVNGIAVTAFYGEDQVADLPNGRWVTFLYDEDMAQITFTSGVETSPFPVYTYTGSSQLIDDGHRHWRINFLSSGILRFYKLFGSVDVFMVGGGGGGGGDNGSGGGGGYTSTTKSMVLLENTNYLVEVGAGGKGGSYTINGVAGGQTTFNGLTANGGAFGGSNGTAVGRNKGGDGGSGGGGNPTTGLGGIDGANGTGTTPGLGQGPTTREFGESGGALYASGGRSATGVAGAANTGNGGGGNTYSATGFAGGSGIMVMRDHRAA